jgi:prevent-host-death family protein
MACRELPFLTMEVTMVKVRVREMKASEFKAKCLQLMDEVAATGESVVITKNGKPVSRLVPYVDKPKSLFGIHRGAVEITGDVVSPVEVDWEALA